MKPAALAIGLLLFSVQAHSQWTGIPKNIELAFDRIELAFRSGDPVSMEDILRPSMKMRLEDTLYGAITGLNAMAKLRLFFADKESVDFHFALPASRTMGYSFLDKKIHYIVGSTIHTTEDGLLCDDGGRTVYYTGSGILYYSKDGKRASVHVDVWLVGDDYDLLIYALNISNHPVPTLFYSGQDD